MHSPNIPLPVPSQRDPQRGRHHQMLPLMGFSQSHPRDLPPSAFRGVRNPRLPPLPGQRTMSCCQRQLRIFSWGNGVMDKTQQSSSIYPLQWAHASPCPGGALAAHYTASFNACFWQAGPAQHQRAAERARPHRPLLPETESDRNLAKLGLWIERQ